MGPLLALHRSRPLPRPPAGPTLRARALALLGLALVGCGGDGGDFPIAPREPFQRDLALSEEAARQVEGEALHLLVRAFTAARADARAEVRTALVTEDFRARVPASDAGLPWPDAQAEVTEWLGAEDGGDLEVTDAPGAFARLDAMLDSIQPGARGEAELHRFRLAPEGGRATGRCELLLAGPLLPDFGGTRDVDPGRGELRVELDLELARGLERWQLVRLDVRRATRVLRRAGPFREVSRALGLAQHEGQENRALLQAGMDVHRTLALGGLTACDWNDDGHPDVLATRKGQRTLLFENDGRGGFRTAPLPIASPLESPAMVLVVDLDGDGRDELVGSEPLAYVGAEARLALWTRSGTPDGSWRRVDDALRLPNPRGLRRLAIQTLVPCDVEGDGDLDLFVAVYGSALSRGEHYNTVEAYDGADNHLLVQTAPLVFSEESEARGITGTQYTYVATAFDFDGDRDVDLLEGNDFGPNVLWRNDGSGHFVADDALGFGGVPAYTMGATLGDPEAEGRWSLYLSNMSSEQGARMVELPAELSDPMRRKVEVIASGNMLLRQGPDGWRDHAGPAGVAEGEWAWGCVFCDLDNDGDQDLAVTNGFTSHSDPVRPDWQTYYWRQVLADARHLERGERSRDANAGLRFEGSFNGYERDRYFLNPDGEAPRAGRVFVEAGYTFGLDDDHDGRAVLPLDVDGDGDLDLVLWTLQGLRLYRNPASPTAFLRVELRDGGSRERALGASVTARWGARRTVGLVRAVDGFQTQLPWDVHLGLGPLADRPEGPVELEVRWPDGELETWRVPLDAPDGTDAAGDEPLGRGRRVRLERGDPDARRRPLPRWDAPARGPLPEDASARGLAPTHGGGREALTRLGLPAVVHLSPPAGGGPAPTWAAGAALAADPGPGAVQCAWVTPVAPGAALPEGLRAFRSDPGLLPGLPDPADVGGPVTVVLDREGHLARVYLREVDVDELRALLAHLAPDDLYPDLLVEAGRRELAAGRFRPAQGLFELCLDRDPSRTDAWDGLARVHLRFGRDAQAHEAYARAVAADPDYALGHYNLGVARTREGDLAAARFHLARSLEVDPDQARAWLALAEACAADRDPEAAVEACERAAQLTTDSAPRTLQGKLLAILERYDEARSALEDALARDPDDGEARAALRKVRDLAGG